MSAYGTKVAEGFSQKLLLEMYDMNLTDSMVNRDYEGEINDVGSKLNILAIERITQKTYTGANLTPDSLYEKNAVLEITEFKSFYWAEKTIDKWKSYIKNPHSTVVTQKADERSRDLDLFSLSFYPDVASGNRVGTDYTTGTVEVDASGNVTGSGTAFTSAMEGRGFKASGQTKWYRVKTVSSGTAMIIEDDFDDVASAYTGGVISAGATFIVEAVTPVQITTANLLTKISAMKLKLDTAERNGFNSVPDSGRILIMPAEFDAILVKASGIALHVPEVFSNLVQKGYRGNLLGFQIFVSNRLSGDNVDGFHTLALHTNWLTFAEKLLEVGMEEDLIGNFGSAYKDLFVYGGKVADKRRGFASEGFFTFSV